MNYADFKKRRMDAKAAVEKMQQANSKKKDFTDPRFFTYTMDKTGNAFAIIRFLPSPNENLPPIVSRYEHTFQKNGNWYIENCPTTVSGKCPVCDYNSAHMDAGLAKEKIQSQFRQQRFFANIMVIKDEQKPENEGKVFLFKFGKTVYEKIMEKGQPDTADEPVVDVTSFESGCNFKLKIKKIGQFPNYDSCTFMSSAPLYEDDEKLEEVYNKLHDLSEFIAPKEFKDYKTLEARLNKVMNGKVVTNGDSSKKEEEKSEPAANLNTKENTPEDKKLPFNDEPKKVETDSSVKKDGEEEVDADAFFDDLDK
jgi:hypothetical protein